MTNSCEIPMIRAEKALNCYSFFLIFKNKTKFTFVLGQLEILKFLEMLSLAICTYIQLKELW